MLPGRSLWDIANLDLRDRVIRFAFAMFALSLLSFPVRAFFDSFDSSAAVGVPLPVSLAKGVSLRRDAANILCFETRPESPPVPILLRRDGTHVELASLVEGSSNDRWIVARDGQGGWSIVDRETGAVDRLIGTHLPLRSIQFDPKSRFLAYSDRETAAVWVRDLEKGTTRTLQVGRPPRSVAFDDSGSFLNVAYPYERDEFDGTGRWLDREGGTTCSLERYSIGFRLDHADLAMNLTSGEWIDLPVDEATVREVEECKNLPPPPPKENECFVDTEQLRRAACKGAAIRFLAARTAREGEPVFFAPEERLDVRGHDLPAESPTEGSPDRRRLRGGGYFGDSTGEPSVPPELTSALPKDWVKDKPLDNGWLVSASEEVFFVSAERGKVLPAFRTTAITHYLAAGRYLAVDGKLIDTATLSVAGTYRGHALAVTEEGWVLAAARGDRRGTPYGPVRWILPRSEQ